MKRIKQTENKHKGRFEFTVTLSGCGECADDAWSDAVSAFAIDPGMPDPERTEVYNLDENGDPIYTE
jgi:hypothetical protein